MLKKVTFSLAAGLGCIANPVVAKPQNLVALVSAQAASLAVIDLTAASALTAVQQSSSLRSKAVLVELSGTQRPAGFRESFADHYAAEYCRSINYSRGRALQVSNIPGGAGLFAYTAVDRLVCYN